MSNSRPLANVRNEVIRRYLDGESISTLARAYGVTHGAIGGHLDRNNIVRRATPYSKRYRTEELEEAMRLYASGLSGPKVEAESGIPISALYGALRRAGVLTHGKLTLAQKDEAETRYQADEPLQNIAADFGVCPSVIRLVLTKRGVRIRSTGEHLRRYSCDHHFFDEVAHELTAYWLGFFAADGCVTHRHNLALSLGTKDAAHVYAFRDALQSDHRVFRPKGRQDRTTIMINSPWLTAGLAKHGVGPRKSLTHEWPDFLSDELLPHYLRGYFDGDGCFSVRRANGQIAAYICGSEFFLYSLRDYLARTLDYPLNKLGTSGLIHRLDYSGNQQLPRFARLLYRNATICLPRKRAIVEHWL